MKKQMHLLVAIIFAAATYLSASTSSKLNLQLKNGDTPGTIKVELQGLDQQNTQLRIQDISGKKWFSEMIRKQTQFSKTINLNALPSGAYLLIVKNKRSQQSRAFRLSGKQVVFFDVSTDAASPGGLVQEAGGASRVITRIAATDARTLRVQLSNIQEYVASMQLVSPDGAVRWEETVSGQASIVKNLDMKSLMIEPGTYILHIQVGAATIIQELEISGSELRPGMAHHVSKAEAAAEMAKN